MIIMITNNDGNDYDPMAIVITASIIWIHLDSFGFICIIILTHLTMILKDPISGGDGHPVS